MMESKEPDCRASPKRGSILFCGAFQMPANGTMGGILFACQTLLSTARAKRESWTLVDSAQPLPAPRFPVRMMHALSRFVRCVYCLIFRHIESTLVFSPFLTMSLLEKLSICLISSWFGKPAVVAFRSEIKFSRRGERWVKPFVGFALSRIHHVICQSKEARQALQDQFPNREFEISVIPNWTRLPSIEKGGVSKSGDGVCRISYIGWLEPIKDVATILKALEIVNRSNQDWKLTICGSGSQRKHLEQLVGEYRLTEQVVFEGWVDSSEKERVLRETDLFVMASVSEGMPNSLVEAMSFGIPIVSSNAGGIPSLVEQGRNGLLFPIGDAQQAAGCMEQLIGDAEIRRRFGENNREDVDAHHNAENAANRVLALLGKTYVATPLRQNQEMSAS